MFFKHWYTKYCKIRYRHVFLHVMKIRRINKVFTLICLLLSISYESFSQHPSEIGQVIYDPLFWKSKLKLTKSQCEQISRINNLFYHLLYSVDNSDSASHIRIDELYFLIHVRSTQIWNIFSDRQKRKWSKLHMSFSLKTCADGSLSLSKIFQRYSWPEQEHKQC
jgi:hypothetical protein